MFLTVYFGILAFILGTVFGSFYNCMAMRVAAKEDFIKGRSHCMSCGHELSAGDLVPVLSYLFSKGRCRYCGEKVSVRYPLTELLFGVLTLTLYLVEIGNPVLAEAGDWVILARDFLLTGMLFSLSIVDLMIYEIPNGMLLTALIGWIVTLPFAFSPFFGGGMTEALHHLLAGLILGGGMLMLSLLMDKILKKDSLGGGDIKLFALLGLYVGYFGDYLVLVFAVLFGFLTIFLLRKERIPWGPSIAAGGYLTLLFGDRILTWYLGLMGL